MLSLLLCSAIACAASSPPLILLGTAVSSPLTGHIDVLEDKTGKLTFDEVRSPAMAARFRPDSRRVLNFGVTSSVYWLRFSISNESVAAKRWLLELDFPHMDYLDLYLPGAGGGFERMQAGDMRPMSIRPFRHRNPVFPLLIDGSITCYLRADAGGGRALMPLTLWTPDAFNGMDNRRCLIDGCYFGAMLVMVLYNLFIFLSLRDRNYLYYILDIFCFALFVFTGQGFLLEFVVGDLPAVNQYIYLLPALVVLAGSLFCRSFLTTRRTAPVIDRILRFLMLVAVLSVPAAVVLPAETVRLLLALLSLGSSATGISAAIVCMRRGVHPARYYLAARIFRVAGVFIYALVMYNLLPLNVLTTSSLQIGSIIEVLLLSFALADRITVMRRETEEAQAEAIRSNHLASLGELAAGVAHEINTPVNTIINSADLILESDDRSEIEHDAAVIKKHGRRIATIVSSLLFFARPSTPVKAPFALTILLQGTMDMIGARLRRERIAISEQIAPDLPEVLVCPQQIEQVFLNILTNAMHALEERHGGASDTKRLDIRASALSVNGQPFVRIAFQDNGIGIPPELVGRVTTSFVTTKKTGTGLGLSICRQIIAEHGGFLRIESRAGEYARVSMDLPVA